MAIENYSERMKDCHGMEATDGLVLAGKKAWHGMGTVVEDAPDAREALKLIDGDWTVIQEPLFLENGTPVETHVANVRDDTQAPLAVVSKAYEPVQNIELVEFLEAVATEAKNIEIETAGTLHGGRRIWFLARMKNEAFDLGEEDVQYPYLSINSGHDGLHGCQFGGTGVRQCCKNTTEMISRDLKGRIKSGTAVSLRHSANIKEKLAEAVADVQGIIKGIPVYREFCEAMVKQKFKSREGVADFYAEVFERAWWAIPTSADCKGDEKKAAKRVRAMDKVGQWIANYDAEMHHGGTLWAAFNGLTGWSDHQRVHRENFKQTHEQQKMMSNVFGGSSTLFKRHAVHAAADLLT